MRRVVEKSRREYEVIMAVCPGEHFDGLALAVNNPDGNNEYALVKGKYETYLGYIPRYVDLIVFTYSTESEHAIAAMLAKELKGVPVKLFAYRPNEFQLRPATRVEKAEWALKAVTGPKGLSFHKSYRGLTVRFFDKMAPKIGSLV